MRGYRRTLELAVIACALAACATVKVPPSESLLNEEHILDLMNNHEKWDGRIVTVRIYPYDHGDPSAYVACFEKCDAAYAEKSPFLIETRPDRFKGFKGDHPVIVRARYSSACFYRSTLCADTRYGLFTEIN